MGKRGTKPGGAQGTRGKGVGSHQPSGQKHRDTLGHGMRSEVILQVPMGIPLPHLTSLRKQRLKGNIHKKFTEH